ncbi:MAG: Hsp20/alpha crystallin family protein [Deltaproteobacteria bacterium]|nr:Hsp20/alpha crystallin family protein [Deltaproteobacteria bacterium]
MPKSLKKQQQVSSTEEPLNIFEYLKAAAQHISQSANTAILSYTPPVNIFYTASLLTIEIEVPGVRFKDINVTLIKGNLLINGTKHDICEEDGVNYHCIERSFGKFYRAVELPFPINTGGIKAMCKNGLLTITAPRVEDKRGIPKHVTVEFIL